MKRDCSSKRAANVGANKHTRNNGSITSFGSKKKKSVKHICEEIEKRQGEILARYLEIESLQKDLI